MSAKLDYLKRVASDQNQKIDIDWSGLTATALSDGTQWIADQLAPDLGISASDIVNATKTLVLGSQDGLSRLIAKITMAQNAPPPSDNLAGLFAADVEPPSGYYTILGISKLGQLVDATMQNADGSTQPVKVLLSGNIAYQYEGIQGTDQRRKSYLSALASGDPSGLFIDLYPSNVSAVVQSDNSKTFGLQHAQPRTVPSPDVLRQANLPLMQGLMCIDGPTSSYNGWMDITDTVSGLTNAQADVNKSSARSKGGININLNGGDIATIIGVLAGASVSTRDQSGRLSVKSLIGFGGISVGISISI